MVSIGLTISGVFAIIAGLLVLVWPRTLNFAVGLWLLIQGIVQVLNF